MVFRLEDTREYFEQFSNEIVDIGGIQVEYHHILLQDIDPLYQEEKTVTYDIQNVKGILRNYAKSVIAEEKGLTNEKDAEFYITKTHFSNVYQDEKPVVGDWFIIPETKYSFEVIEVHKGERVYDNVQEIIGWHLVLKYRDKIPPELNRNGALCDV